MRRTARASSPACSDEDVIAMTAVGEPPEIDFFVSYTSADRGWAEWIAWQLEEAGYRVLVQAWDFPPGSSFIGEMHRATELSAKTLAVLSPAYLSSAFAQPEWQARMREDPKATARALLPVRVERCEPRGVLGGIVYVDLVDVDEPEARDRLLAGAQNKRARPSQPPPFPSSPGSSTTAEATVAEKPVFPPLDPDDHPTPPGKRRGWWRRRTVVAALGVCAVVLVLVLVPGGSSDQQLVIYSSLPELEQQQLRRVDRKGAARNPGVVENQRTTAMETAMQLALDLANDKASAPDVTYKRLDDSDASGQSPAAVVQRNARTAAADENTAVYIGDFTSGATQESIPILSRARIPQISVSSTRVGLTTEDPRGDVDEPDRYYCYYPEGYRNFVRIIPTTAVHARALVAVMTKQQRPCEKVAMIDDDSSYGEALANDILDTNRLLGKQRRMRFVFSQSVGPYGAYQHLVDRARARKPDCFVYSGIRNPNTIEIFDRFAGALPVARLYGTNGVIATSFLGGKRGLPRAVAARVTIMVPPYQQNSVLKRFVKAFTKRYGKGPDPYAIYAYEAMQIALEAIRDSQAANRDELRDIVRDNLFDTVRDSRHSVLGDYSINQNGDTTQTHYGVSKVRGGALTPPKPAPYEALAE